MPCRALPCRTAVIASVGDNGNGDLRSSSPVMENDQRTLGFITTVIPTLSLSLSLSLYVLLPSCLCLSIPLIESCKRSRSSPRSNTPFLAERSLADGCTDSETLLLISENFLKIIRLESRRSVLRRGCRSLRKRSRDLSVNDFPPGPFDFPLNPPWLGFAPLWRKARECLSAARVHQSVDLGIRKRMHDVNKLQLHSVLFHDRLLIIPISSLAIRISRSRSVNSCCE